jgi:hypothetical protein
MSNEARFKRELDDLWRSRSHWLRHVLSAPSHGKPPRFTRDKREKAITRLLEIVSDDLAHDLARSEFNKRVKKRKNWRNQRTKGRNRQEKQDNFRRWYVKNIGKKHCVYIFWGRRSCLYVGETDKPSGRRVASHFTKYWFNQTRRIEICVPKKTYLPSLECLAIHAYKPKYNTLRAPRKKGRTKCPLCRLEREIKAELRLLLPT